MNVDTATKIALGVVVLTFAGMVLRNTGGVATVINAFVGGFHSLISGAGGGTPHASYAAGYSGTPNPAVNPRGLG